MDVRGENIQPFELLYYLALGLFLTGAVLLDTFYAAYSSPELEVTLCMVCILLVVCREILYEEYDLSDWLCLILSAVFFLNAVYIGSLLFATIFIMVFGGRNIPFRRIAKFAVWLIIILFVFSIVSAKLGIIRNYINIESDRSNREYLGFLSALYPGNYFFTITGLLLYVYREKLPWAAYIVLAAGNYWVYQKINGRTAFYMTVFVLLGGIILKIWPHLVKHLRAVNFLLTLTAPVCTAVSFWMAWNYSPSDPQLFSLNTLLSGRLYYTNLSLTKYGLKPYGQDIPWNGNGLTREGLTRTVSYFYVDNMFVNFWQMYGWIMGAAVTLLIFLAMYFMYRKKKYYMLLLSTAFLLFGTMDNSMMKIWYNLFYIAMASEIFGAGRREYSDG